MIPVHDAYNLFDRVRIFVFLLLRQESSDDLKKMWLEDIRRSLPRVTEGKRIGKVEVDEEAGRYVFHYSRFAGEDAAGDDHGYGELMVVQRTPLLPGAARAVSYQIWYESYQYAYSGEGGAQFRRSVDELMSRTEPAQMKAGWGLKMFRENTPVLL